MNSGDTVEPTTALRRGEEDGEMGMVGRRLGVERNGQKGGQGPGHRPVAWLTSRLHSDTLAALCRPLGSLLHVMTTQTDGPIHTRCGECVPHARPTCGPAPPRGRSPQFPLHRALARVISP